ncbi:MAG: hypothetical protein TIS_00494 [Tissierella sp.]
MIILLAIPGSVWQYVHTKTEGEIKMIKNMTREQLITKQETINILLATFGEANSKESKENLEVIKKELQEVQEALINK